MSPSLKVSPAILLFLTLRGVKHSIEVFFFNAREGSTGRTKKKCGSVM